MYRIERWFGGTPETYPVFTEAEARERGLDVKDWTRVGVGEWGRTDDGYVQCCHDIYTLDREWGYALQFKYTSGRPLAGFTPDGELHDAQPFPFLEYLKTGGHQFSKPQTWQEREAKKNRTERACRAWASFWILRNGELQSADWAAIGRTYRTDDAIDNPEATARKLFNEDEIQRKAMNELAKNVAAAGEHPEDIIDKYNELFEEALASGGEGAEQDLQVAHEVARDLRDMLSMNPNRRPDPSTDNNGIGGMLDVVEEQEANVKEISDADTESLPEPPQ